jgi:glycerol-3-phosphate dehydrogenase
MSAMQSREIISEPRTEHFDVLIVGAGISGIGSAHHLQEPVFDPDQLR